MNLIYKWAASKLLADWTETTWWKDAVFPEFARDATEKWDRASDRNATEIGSPEEPA
jgi:hypothetical protein